MCHTGRHLPHGGQAGEVGQLLTLLLNHVPGVVQRPLTFKLSSDVTEDHNRAMQFITIQFRCRTILHRKR